MTAADDAPQYKLGAVYQVPEPRNRSGRGVTLSHDLDLSAVEADQLRADLRLVTKYAIASPYNAVLRRIDRIDEGIAAALTSWRSTEVDPLLAHREGIVNLVAHLGADVLALNHLDADDARTSIAQDLKHRRLTIEYVRGTDAAAAAVIRPESSSDGGDVCNQMRELASAAWVSTLLEHEEEIRDAVRRTRVTTAPIIDGVPTLFEYSGEDRTRPKMTHIEPGLLAACMDGVNQARAIRAIDDAARGSKQPPPTVTPSNPSANSATAEMSPETMDEPTPVEESLSREGADRTATTGASAQTTLDRDIMDLALMTNGLLEATRGIEARWSESLGHTGDVGGRFELLWQTLAHVYARIALYFEHAIYPKIGFDSRLPEMPPQPQTVVAHLTSDDPEARHRTHLLANLTCFHHLTLAVESLRAPMIEHAGSAERFWHSGAFESLAQHLDWFQQTLLQELDSAAAIEDVRRTIGGRAQIDPRSRVVQRLAFTVQAGDLGGSERALATHSWLMGDYGAVIYHACASIRALGGPEAMSVALAERNASNIDDDYQQVVQLAERSLTAEGIDAAATVMLASSLMQLLDILHQPRSTDDQ